MDREDLWGMTATNVRLPDARQMRRFGGVCRRRRKQQSCAALPACDVLISGVSRIIMIQAEDKVPKGDFHDPDFNHR